MNESIIAHLQSSIAKLVAENLRLKGQVSDLETEQILEAMDWCLDTHRPTHNDCPISRYSQLASICAELVWRRRFMQDCAVFCTTQAHKDARIPTQSVDTGDVNVR